MKFEQIGVIAILLVIVSCVGFPLISEASYTTNTEIIEAEATYNNGGARYQVIMGSSDTYVYSGSLSPGEAYGDITKNGTTIDTNIHYFKAYGIEFNDYGVTLVNNSGKTTYEWIEPGQYGTFTITYSGNTLSFKIDPDWDSTNTILIDNVPFIVWPSTNGNYANMESSNPTWFKSSNIIGIESPKTGYYMNGVYHLASSGETAKTNIQTSTVSTNEYGYDYANRNFRVTYGDTNRTLFAGNNIYVPYQVTYTTTEEVEVEVKSAYADVLGAIPIVCIAAIVISIGMWTYNFKKN